MFIAFIHNFHSKSQIGSKLCNWSVFRLWQQTTSKLWNMAKLARVPSGMTSCRFLSVAITLKTYKTLNFPVAFIICRWKDMSRTKASHPWEVCNARFHKTNDKEGTREISSHLKRVAGSPESSRNNREQWKKWNNTPIISIPT